MPQGSGWLRQTLSGIRQGRRDKIRSNVWGHFWHHWALTVDPTYIVDEVDIPIDALALDLARLDDEGGDSGGHSWPLEKRCFFARRDGFFRRLFGRVDFVLAYTLHISIWSSVSALSISVSCLYLFSYGETDFVRWTNLSPKCASMARPPVSGWLPITKKANDKLQGGAPKMRILAINLFNGRKVFL